VNGQLKVRILKSTRVCALNHHLKTVVSRTLYPLTFTKKDEDAFSDVSCGPRDAAFTNGGLLAVIEKVKKNEVSPCGEIAEMCDYLHSELDVLNLC